MKRIRGQWSGSREREQWPVASGRWSVERDQGSGIGEPGLGAGGQGIRTPGNYADHFPRVTNNSLPSAGHRPPTTGHSLSPLPSPLSSASARSGLSLLEVLVSIGILLFGLTAVAMLIPVGKLAMVETNKSDRAGACGRAALRDIKVRGMLNYGLWWTQSPGAVVLPTDTPGIIAIDPMGYANLPTTLAGVTSGIPRYTLWETVGGGPKQALSPTSAAALCRWADELTFEIPPGSTTRPRAMALDNWQRVVPYPVLPSDPVLAPAATSWTPLDSTKNNVGNVTWFLTIAPSPADALATPVVPVSQRTIYSVSVVVCYKRVLSSVGGVTDAEDSASFTGAIGGAGAGGVTLQISNSKWPSKWSLKNDDWILLSGGGQTTWYRVVGVGYDGTNTYITLVGPDWLGGTTGTAVSISGVRDVYTETVQLN